MGFQLFTLNILWLLVADGEGIFGAALILATSFAFRAVSSLATGYIVDNFDKKGIILLSLGICALLSMLWLGAQFLAVAMVVYITIMLVQDLYGNSINALAAEKLISEDFIKYNAMGIMTGRIMAIGGNLASAALIAILPDMVVGFVLAGIFLTGLLICQRFLPKSDVARKQRSDVRGTQKSDNIRVKLRGKAVAAWGFAKENVFKSKGVMTFVVVVFLLNLDYAFITAILPLYIITIAEIGSPLVLGAIRAGSNVGGFLASGVILKYSRHVSRLTKVGLAGSGLLFLSLPFAYRFPIIVIIFFLVHGFFDMLTQPFYSYFFSSLAVEKRGRVIGIVDSIILMASPLGVLLGSLLSILGIGFVGVGIGLIFGVAYIIVAKSKSYGAVRL